MYEELDANIQLFQAQLEEIYGTRGNSRNLRQKELLVMMATWLRENSEHLKMKDIKVEDIKLLKKNIKNLKHTITRRDKKIKDLQRMLTRSDAICKKQRERIYNLEQQTLDRPETSTELP